MSRRRKARMHPNGRNTGSTAFLMLDNYIFDCLAYRTMKPGPRTLLWELIRRFNGSNNGAIGLGVREAADQLGVTKDTASGYFRELIERGFIASARPGGFNMKDPQSRRATEWRLTWMKTDCMAATKDFLVCSKKSTVLNIRTAGPKNLDADKEKVAECPENLDLSGHFRRSIGPKNPDTYTSSHRRGAIEGRVDRSSCASTWAAIRNAFQPIEAMA